MKILSKINQRSGMLLFAMIFSISAISYGAMRCIKLPDNATYCNGAPTAVVEVTSATGRVWMDRNLGATRAATSSTDTAAYGDLYQWGRGTDGHQCRTSATTTTLSSSDQPGHGDFIINSTGPYPYDWRSPQNNALWQGVNGVNNPCPAGFRLPTDAEWQTELSSWASANPVGAFSSPLKLPLAGYRDYYTNGLLYDVGAHGIYWSSKVAGTKSYGFGFHTNNAGLLAPERAVGYSVRCIKN